MYRVYIYYTNTEGSGAAAAALMALRPPPWAQLEGALLYILYVYSSRAGVPYMSISVYSRINPISLQYMHLILTRRGCSAAAGGLTLYRVKGVTRPRRQRSNYWG